MSMGTTQTGYPDRRRTSTMTMATRVRARMASASTVIPIDHQPTVHEIDTRPDLEPRSITLLELIDAVSEVSENEQEVVATVTYMLESGRIRLAGGLDDPSFTQLCG